MFLPAGIFVDTSSCIKGHLGLCEFSICMLLQTPRCSPWRGVSSLVGSSRPAHPAYFRGQQTLSHSRRLCWLLLCCHDNLVRWSSTDNLLWMCMCLLGLQVCVRVCVRVRVCVHAHVRVLGQLQTSHPLFALHWMVTIAVNAAQCPRILPLHHSINKNTVFSIMWTALFSFPICPSNCNNFAIIW